MRHQLVASLARLALVAGLPVVVSAQTTEIGRGGVPLAKMPAAWQPAVARAEGAMNSLQGALLSRLQGEVRTGGAAGALRVCHDEAAAIASQVAEKEGIRLGRTSHALRSASNVSPAWAASLVAESAGRKAADVGVRVFDLGGRLGVLRPIGFVEMCATCHGAPSSIPPDFREAIVRLYPQDKATGFGPGDLRGWMWAEVPLAAQ